MERKLGNGDTKFRQITHLAAVNDEAVRRADEVVRFLPGRPRPHLLVLPHGPPFPLSHGGVCKNS